MTDGWSIQFTQRFRADLEAAPPKVAARWLEKLEFLRGNPYERNPNAKVLKGGNHLFRLRVGSIRIIYRVIDDLRLVLLLRAIERQVAYEIPLDLWDREGPNEITHVDVDAQLQTLPGDPIPEIPRYLLDEDELNLIRIPDQFHETIHKVTDIAELQSCGIPADVASRVEDYLTVPGQTHVGRIYALEAQQSLPAIAAMPLCEFMLALDRQQKEVIERPLDGGPYLIRGGPGTGKTLIALYRLKALYEWRATESLFDAESGNPYILFVTFTRMLARTGDSLLGRLLPNQRDMPIVVRNFDEGVARLSEKLALRPARILDERDAKELLITAVESLRGELNAANLDDFNNLIDTFGEQFLLEEIEDVLYGHGIACLADYLSFERTGRKTPLRQRLRSSLWMLFERFEAALDQRGVTTFERKRLHVLRALQTESNGLNKANALYVDEIQDLSPTSIRLLLHLVKDPRYVTFLGDSGQSIYRRSSPWKSINGQLRFNRGNSFMLSRSYRCTKALERSLSPLRLDTEATDQESSFSTAVFEGPEPHWLKRPRNSHKGWVVDIVRQLTDERKINPGQIAVIVRFNWQMDEIVATLNQQSIPAYGMDKSAGVQLESARIHILTAHSSKGLEFPFVIVPYVSDDSYPCSRKLLECRDDGEREELVSQERRLLYVALSRASHEAWMITDLGNPSRFTKQLDVSDWDTSP